MLKLIPVAVVVAPVLIRRGPGAPDRAVLHWAVIGPVAFLLALSLATGCQLRDIWGSPLWTFTGLWLMSVAGSLSPGRLRCSRRVWAAVGTGMLVFWSVKNLAQPHLYHMPTRVTFPGRPLAEEVVRRWYARCPNPFCVVAGEAWRAGNLCCFAPHRPVIYSNGAVGYFVFEPEYTPWTSDADMVRRGGVLVWDANQIGDGLLDSVRARFPSAEVQPPIILPYQTSAAVQPERVGVAFIWPETGGPVK
jgi:hypothetical protein